MIKMIAIFVTIAVLVHLAIAVWRSLSKKDKWSLTKMAGYSIIVASVAGLVLYGIVLAF